MTSLERTKKADSDEAHHACSKVIHHIAAQKKTLWLAAAQRGAAGKAVKKRRADKAARQLKVFRSVPCNLAPNRTLNRCVGGWRC